MKKYHYTESGLNNIYLLNGFELTKTNDGDEELFIHDIHGLHEAIGRMLVSKPSLLNGNEIKFIRNTLDLSQTNFGRILGCTYQTVLHWEKDNHEIPPTADRLLKFIFLSYLNKDKGGVIYDTVNEIADLDAESVSVDRKELFEFQEISDGWKGVCA